MEEWNEKGQGIDGMSGEQQRKEEHSVGREKKSQQQLHG